MNEKVRCDVCGTEFSIFLESDRRAEVTRYFFRCKCGKEFDAYYESSKTKTIQDIYKGTHRGHMRKKLKKQWDKKQKRCKAAYWNAGRAGGELC